MSEDKVNIDLETTRALALTQGGANAFSIVPQNMRDMLEFAKLMAVSGPCVRPQFRNKPGACLAIALQAFRTGADPFAVANKAYVTTSRAGDEQISYEAQYIHAVINNSGLLQKRLRPEYAGIGGKRRCILNGYIKGEADPFTYESPAIEDIQVKNSPLWRSDPDQQLFYYSTRAWARRYAPEIAMGMYTPEEVRTIDHEASASPAAMLDDFAKADTMVDYVNKRSAAPETPAAGDSPVPPAPDPTPVSPPQAPDPPQEYRLDDEPPPVYSLADAWARRHAPEEEVRTDEPPAIYSFADSDGEIFDYDAPLDAAEGFILLMDNAETSEKLEVIWTTSHTFRSHIQGIGNLGDEIKAAYDAARIRLSPPAPPQADALDELGERCMAAAKKGLRAFHQFYLKLPPEELAIVKPMRANWEKLAKEARS